MELKINTDFFFDYSERLGKVMSSADWSGVAKLAQAIHQRWEQGGGFIFVVTVEVPVTPYIWPMIFYTVSLSVLAVA